MPVRRAGSTRFWDLERFLEGAAKASLDLPEVERESERRGRELVRLALQAHIDSRGDGDVGQAIVAQAADGPVRLAYKRLHSRPVLTLFGEVRVTRMGYGAPGRYALHPLDAELMLPGRIYSYECQRRLLKAIVCSPFDEAITFMAEMTGVAVPKRSAELLVREAAVDFEAFYAQRAGADVEPAEREIVVAAIDCKGIPIVKPERALRVVRRGKGEKANKKRWEQLQPWLVARVELPVGPLFCSIDGPTRGRPWSSSGVRVEFRRLAAQAGVRRRFAPHQLRHAHAVELAAANRLDERLSAHGGVKSTGPSYPSAPATPATSRSHRAATSR